jgi:hypothetical protein
MFLLAVVAILFSVDQYIGSRKLDRLNTQILETAKQTADATTSRFVGRFPANVPQITEVASQTCEALNIMADVPGYGQFSAQKQFRDYLSAVERVASTPLEESSHTNSCLGKTPVSQLPGGTINVRLLVFDPDLMHKRIANQFRKYEGTGYEALKNNPLFISYFSVHKRRPQPANLHEFVQVLEQSNVEYVHELKNHGIDIRVSDHPYMLFLWLRDGEDAVFSFDYQRGAHGEEEEEEIPFRTRDTKLLSALSGIFENEWGRAKQP